MANNRWGKGMLLCKRAFSKPCESLDSILLVPTHHVQTKRQSSIRYTGRTSTKESFNLRRRRKHEVSPRDWSDGQTVVSFIGTMQKRRNSDRTRSELACKHLETRCLRAMSKWGLSMFLHSVQSFQGQKLRLPVFPHRRRNYTPALAYPVTTRNKQQTHFSLRMS